MLEFEELEPRNAPSAPPAPVLSGQPAYYTESGHTYPAIVLSWSDTAAVTSWTIQVSSDGGKKWQTYTFPANETGWVNWPLHAGVTYEYRLAASNADGQSGWSNIVAIVALPKTSG